MTRYYISPRFPYKEKGLKKDFTSGFKNKNNNKIKVSLFIEDT